MKAPDAISTPRELVSIAHSNSQEDIQNKTVKDNAMALANLSSHLSSEPPTAKIKLAPSTCVSTSTLTHQLHFSSIQCKQPQTSFDDVTSQLNLSSVPFSAHINELIVLCTATLLCAQNVSHFPTSGNLFQFQNLCFKLKTLSLRSGYKPLNVQVAYKKCLKLLNEFQLSFEHQLKLAPANQIESD